MLRNERTPSASLDADVITRLFRHTGSHEIKDYDSSFRRAMSSVRPQATGIEHDDQGEKETQRTRGIQFSDF
jgi:hypothetical protein